MNFRAVARSGQPINLAVAMKYVEQAARLSVEQAAAAVLETAESIVPVDTGELRTSGKISVGAVDGTTISAQVIFDADHAAYVEFGTGIRGAASPGAGPGPYNANWPGMPSQPYVRPALDIERPHILEIFQDNADIASKLIGGK